MLETVLYILTIACDVHDFILDFLARHSIAALLIASFLLDAYMMLVYKMLKSWVGKDEGMVVEEEGDEEEERD